MDAKAARILAVNMMHDHWLRGWTFDFDRAKNRVGACHYQKRKITLSAALLPNLTEDQVQQTMLHEIAHALTGREGKKHHGPRWRATAEYIGYRGGRTLDVLPAEHRYTGRCDAGHVFKRHRRPAAGKNLRCTKCFYADIRNPYAGLLVWTDSKDGSQFRTYSQPDVAVIPVPNPKKEESTKWRKRLGVE